MVVWQSAGDYDRDHLSQDAEQGAASLGLFDRGTVQHAAPISHLQNPTLQLLLLKIMVDVCVCVLSDSDHSYLFAVIYDVFEPKKI